MQMHSTKISGLAVDTEYTFHLVLRTTAGTFASERVTVRTHKMTDLSGITITTGVMPATTREKLAEGVERIGAKLADTVRIDTTHFVTTEGRGQAWEKAVENNIPVVRPEWVEACEKNGRILGVTKFYLDAMRPGPPSDEQVAPPVVQQSPQPLPQSPPQETPAEAARVAEREAESESEEDENEVKPQTPHKPSTGAEEEGDSDDDEPEQKTRAGEEPSLKTPQEQNEQKVRLEDKEHQVPIRSAGANQEKDGEDEGTQDEDGEKDEKKEGGAHDKAATPPDGNSFQDVAL